MFRSYLKFIIRNLSRNLGHTSINVLGLSLGITCSLVLFLMISYFKSFDQFNENADHIYRIVTSVDENGGAKNYDEGIPKPLPDAFRTVFPEINSGVFIQLKNGKTLIGVENEDSNLKYYETSGRVAYVESSYFDVFTRKILSGNTENLLNEPNQVIISKTLADHYFLDKNPIGQTLTMDKEIPLTITAVIEDHPQNTAFPFNMLISYATIKKSHENRTWDQFSSSSQFYMVINDDRVIQSIENRMPNFVSDHYGENTFKRDFHLQTMQDILTDRRFGNFGSFTIGKGEYLSMWLVSLFMIITACINFINLSTALAIKRSKEVGIRKVLGSARLQLIGQFLGETLVITFIAILMSIGLAELLVMSVNPYLGIDIQMKLLTNSTLHLYLLILWFGITLVAGIYPAFVLSGYKPIHTLKNLITYQKSGKFSLRRGLVVFQLFMSQLYIIGTIILLAQLNYMREADPGFTADSIMVFSTAEYDENKSDILKNELSNLAEVERVSLASSTPSSNSRSSTQFTIEGHAESFKTTIKFVDDQYIDLFEIPLHVGTNLFKSDSMSGVIVNQEWVRMLGYEDPREVLGLMVDVWERTVPVVGVINDFHAHSMARKIEPLLMISYAQSHRLVSIKLSSNHLESSIQNISKVWEKVYPEYNFEYSFVDDQLANMYIKEEKMFGILSVFSVITILISCMGLFGLASFMVNRKMKEVGIRKVMGASVNQIISIFTKEYARLIFIAFILAVPMIWYGMSLWLSNFEYKVEINVAMFVAGMALITIISLLTVITPTWRASLANPTDSLRNE